MGECASTSRAGGQRGGGANGKADAAEHRAEGGGGDSKSSLSCLKAVDNDTGGPFHYRVEFRGPLIDHEASVIKTLTELLWVAPVAPGRPGAEGNSVEASVSRCVAALQKMKSRQGEKLQDYVVPIANVVLHAPSQVVRSKLWGEFVVDQVKQDWTLGHLFYWAFRCVANSPDAESSTREDAEQKCALISKELFSRAQSLGLQILLETANDAARRGRPQPQVGKTSADSVTPLIDLLNRLHKIGCDIVKVKDKEERLETLRSLIKEGINEATVGPTPVPALMLAPHSYRYRDQVPASVLQLPVEEARVLSSKERAPYLVLLEVETHQIDGDPGPFFQQRRGICCRRAAKPTSQAANGAGKERRESNQEDFSGEIKLMRQSSCEAKNLVTDKLLEHDPRPKGIFKKEDWPQVVERVKNSSVFGSRPGWRMISLIVKSNADDVRQEELAYRLLRWFQHVFARQKLRLWLQPFLIVATTHDGGVLETVSNAISLSELKKTYGDRWVSLKSYFDSAFALHSDTCSGGSRTVGRNDAIMNFIWSMAAYSVVCYVLAIRDRHNGNILIDDEGHILHVDFGFMLCGAPGGKMLQRMGGFEHSQGFKLTDELAEVLHQAGGEPFKVFRKAMEEGMLAVRKHADELLALLQLSMLGTENSKQRCFSHPRGHPEAVLEDVCERLALPHSAGTNARPGRVIGSDEEFSTWVNKMIDDSVGHWRSRLYDKYQYHFTDVH